MRVGALRKLLAQRGLSPMGDKDELVKRLMESAVASDEPVTAASDPVDVARKIVQLEEDKATDEEILSVLGTAVTSSSSKKELKKAYLKISLMVHPDKIGSRYKKATTAFQRVVMAYEHLSQPELFVEKKTSAKDDFMRVSRTNSGCFRTKMQCPRCKSEWGSALSGVEKAAYTHLMVGIKTYHCALCLLEFGCMTAVHLCPFCKKPFEYDPEQYHEKVLCGNACTRKFGFWLYEISKRRQNELRKELKQQQEKRMQRSASQASRQRRGAKRRGESLKDDDDDDGPDVVDEVEREASRLEEEAAFVLGLVDACPRCGYETPRDQKERKKATRDHLKTCTDKEKIKAFQRKKDALAAKEAKKSDGNTKQEQLQSLRTWEYLGASVGSAWLLTDEQLRGQCRKRGVATAGLDTADLVNALADAPDPDTKLLTDGNQPATKPRKARRVVNVEELPSNPWALTVPQLRAVCAASGIQVPSGARKAQLVDLVQGAREGEEAPLLLQHDDKDSDSDDLPLIQYQAKNKPKPKSKKRTGRQTKKAPKKRKKQVVESDSGSEAWEPG